MNDIRQELDLCEWLMNRGLGLEECAWVLSDLYTGYTFPLALLNVFHDRKLLLEKCHAKNNDISDWGNPITP